MNGIYKTQDKYFFRAAFPRSRMLKQLEDDLSVFVQLISSDSRLPKEEFEKKFDSDYSGLHHLSEKTIKNHRTEMTSLFGLLVSNDEEIVYPSSRTMSLVETQDFNLFFRSFCNKFQFPNCINKPQETIRQINNNVRFKPAKFILQIMVEGTNKFGKEFSVTAGEIANLVFNDIRVLSGADSPSKVLQRIIDLRKNKMGFAGGSYLVQHGREFLGYLMLAGLLKSKEPFRTFSLDESQADAIDYIIKSKDFFEIPSEYCESLEVRNKINHEWSLWFGELGKLEESKLESVPSITAGNLTEEGKEAIITDEEGRQFAYPRIAQQLKDIGDLGEMIALKFEQDNVAQLRPDKLALVKLVSNDTELGYDLQSFELNDFQKKKFIEVKTTKRTFTPQSDVLTFFPMSSNEWDTAVHHKDSYYIYRVFLIKEGAQIFSIKNPAEKYEQGKILLEPLKYRVVVKSSAGEYLANKQK